MEDKPTLTKLWKLKRVLGKKMLNPQIKVGNATKEPDLHFKMSPKSQERLAQQSGKEMAKMRGVLKIFLEKLDPLSFSTLISHMTTSSALTEVWRDFCFVLFLSSFLFSLKRLKKRVSITAGYHNNRRNDRSALYISNLVGHLNCVTFYSQPFSFLKKQKANRTYLLPINIGRLLKK